MTYKLVVLPGLCHCGCGQRTEVASASTVGRGWVRGEPLRFRHGHRWGKRHALYGFDVETGCMNWLRAVNGDGYGYTVRGGRSVRAHRYFYELINGPVDRGLVIDHLCRNRRCVNVDHLEPVTQAENCRRGARAVITSAVAAAIRVDDGPGTRLAERHGISYGEVQAIRRGERWGA